jgi:hypothetical protein
LFEDVADVDAAGYELRPLLRHRPQKSFPSFVNECHIVKVDDAARLVLSPPHLNEAALQYPPPLGRRLVDGDFQHVALRAL